MNLRKDHYRVQLLFHKVTNKILLISGFSIVFFRESMDTLGCTACLAERRNAFRTPVVDEASEGRARLEQWVRSFL